MKWMILSEVYAKKITSIIKQLSCKDVFSYWRETDGKKNDKNIDTLVYRIPLLCNNRFRAILQLFFT
jgi:hypothetical protein